MAAGGFSAEIRRAGLRVAVYEARGRIGGRIFTYRDPRVPLPVELGAEFVHGDAPETGRLLREARSFAYDVQGERWSARGGQLQPLHGFWKRIERVLGLIDPERKTDEPFAAFLARQPGGRSLSRDRTLTRQFVQGFHAADLRRVSTKSLAGDGAAPSRSAPGPAALEGLAMGPVLRLSVWFEELPWQGKRDLSRLGFLHTGDPAFPVWWSAYRRARR